MVRRLGAIVPALLCSLSAGAASAEPPRLGLPELERRGSGDVPMILIPDMSMRWRFWAPFMERNVARYAMYAVTPPGFGGAPVPDLPYNGDDPAWQPAAADAIARLIETEDLEDAVLLSQGWGVHLANLVAARTPDRVRAIINVNGNPTSPTRWFGETRADRLAAARRVEARLDEFQDPERWREFNTPHIHDPDRFALIHGMQMATPKRVLIQYWRENALIDQNAIVRGFDIPMLHFRSLWQETAAARQDAAERWEADLAEADLLDRSTTVYCIEYDWFISEDHPALLDAMVADYLAGEPVPERIRPGAED